ncbi:hypothetical protein OTK49_00180 [Vibrio coralliirubri]|uniref:hypothetical protein n=1 Tax=Vibrio coralliirubri TaxID=1516159 RepID=UPI002284BD48|nr:hypothetical protein [Vibrio coralliirubri]MCY9860957.1 hypothetical protein [Vibrio coralliirubri]
MAYKLKLLTASVMAIALTGCGSTAVLNPVSNISDSNLALADKTGVQVIEQSHSVDSESVASLEESSEIKIQELKNTIMDDFSKKKMIIEMECQPQKVHFATSIESPYTRMEHFDSMKDEAEQILADMSDRMGENPAPSLQFAYEQEVARLKLEFQIAELEEMLNDVESQKSRELNKVVRYSSDLFECAARATEAKAEMERQIRIVDMGQNVSIIYDSKIIDLTNKLVEARYELDSVNSESFEGDWEEYSQPFEDNWQE